MSHGHGVDNCSLRFWRKGRQLNLGESRSPTQIFRRNLQPASHRFWAYVCAFGLGLMVMMVMVMAMVMVMVMVLEALKRVCWLHQRQRQSLHRLRAFYWPKLPQTQSFPLAQCIHKLRVLHRPKASAGKQPCDLRPESWKAGNIPALSKLPHSFQLISDFRAGESLKLSYVNMVQLD